VCDVRVGVWRGFVAWIICVCVFFVFVFVGVLRFCVVFTCVLCGLCVLMCVCVVGDDCKILCVCLGFVSLFRVLCVRVVCVCMWFGFLWCVCETVVFVV